MHVMGKNKNINETRNVFVEHYAPNICLSPYKMSYISDKIYLIIFKG